MQKAKPNANTRTLHPDKCLVVSSLSAGLRPTAPATLRPMPSPPGQGFAESAIPECRAETPISTGPKADDYPNGPNARSRQRRFEDAFYLARKFQNRNHPGKLISSINGRHLFKTQTLAGHGCRSVKRQRNHGTEAGLNPSRPRNHRLAQALSNAREARLHLSETAPRRLCGRLLLARLPPTLSDAS